MKKTLLILSIAMVAFACRKDDTPALPAVGVLVNPSETVTGGVQGFFLLNEGLNGHNNASLDYYDYSTGRYLRGIFDERNPSEMGLGDTGNDMKIYGGKLYIVLNGSNMVKVLDVATARQIAEVPVVSPRAVAFSGANAYVTSFDGFVARIDTVSLAVTGQCQVGRCPEEVAVVGSVLYVANSGGMSIEGFDRTLSVVDLGTFAETARIDVAVNPVGVCPDGVGNIYVSSPGNYYDVAAATYVVEIASGEVTKTLPVANSSMALHGGVLYIMGVSYDSDWNPINSCATVRVADGQVGEGFVDAGAITTPYGLAVHPATGEFVVADAEGYATSGTVRCFTAAGVQKWAVTAGSLPARMAFTKRALKI